MGHTVSEKLLYLDVFSKFLIDWLVGLFIYWLNDRSTDKLIKFIDCFIKCLIDWLIVWFAYWLIYLGPVNVWWRRWVRAAGHIRQIKLPGVLKVRINRIILEKRYTHIIRYLIKRCLIKRYTITCSRYLFIPTTGNSRSDHQKSNIPPPEIQYSDHRKSNIPTTGNPIFRPPEMQYSNSCFQGSFYCCCPPQ